MATAVIVAGRWRDKDVGGAREARETKEAKVTYRTHGPRVPSSQRFSVNTELCMDAC